MSENKSKLKKHTFFLDEESVRLLECMKTHHGMTYRYAVEKALKQAFSDCIEMDSLSDRRNGAERRSGIRQS